MMADRIWKSYYVQIITMEQIEYMLNEFYSYDSMIQQMEEGQEFYLIEEENEELGFISISKKGNRNWFIHKFYIDVDKHSKNIGSRAFQSILDLIETRDGKGETSIRLTVNRNNFQSINFYFKNGFKIEKVEDFDIGNGYYMNDFIMMYQR
jgi:ribosomal protein S18 acetylase RimI-like enzyme